MKTKSCLVLALALSTSLFAQDATNTPAAKPAAPEIPIPTEPLSQATLDKIAAMTPIFDGKTLDGWKASKKGVNEMDVATQWTVTNGVIASLGAGRGVLYTTKQYGSYRIIFNMRHVSGNKDHQACVLVYCYEPTEEQPALDAIGGVQFQVPNGGSWDYRPGKNNGGKGVFIKPPHPKFNVHEWSQVEILVNTNGTARMAVAQPPGNKAVETLDFNDPTAGRVGPFALQMHNGGLFDEYKDIRVEENPTEDKLITTESDK
jgi:hypothetical protein